MVSRRSVVAGLLLVQGAARAEAQVPLPAPASWRFDFRGGLAGYRAVTPGTLYDKAAGFGFEPPVPGMPAGAAQFSLAVPEGNYRVTFEFGGQAASDTTIKAESRRLMLESIRTAAGKIERRSIVVNVRNPVLPLPNRNAPGFDRVDIDNWELGSYTWDEKLTLEFAGPAPSVARLEIEAVSVPTVYIAGDSTVTDQRYEPNASWGQMLPRFFKPDVAVANHAESGETLKSFITGRRLDKVLQRMKAGDYLFVQFGHNDAQRSWPHTFVDAATTYRDYLKVYIGEARSRGATPVLVASMSRRQFDAAGKAVNTLGAYPDAVRAVARETGAALIDLNAMSLAFYQALGPIEAPKAFASEGRDPTHFNNYGAYMLARCVVEGIRAGVPALAAHLADDAGRFDPAKPPPPGDFKLAPSRPTPIPPLPPRSGPIEG